MTRLETIEYIDECIRRTELAIPHWAKAPGEYAQGVLIQMSVNKEDWLRLRKALTDE